jgi:hypothetical protein
VLWILAGHLQIDSDPVPDLAYHFDADPDSDPGYKMTQIHADHDPDADPDPQHWAPGYLCVIVILIQTKTQMGASIHETSVSTFCPYLIGSSYCYLIGFNLNVWLTMLKT